jgi:hypothetical protein
MACPVDPDNCMSREIEVNSTVTLMELKPNTFHAGEICAYEFYPQSSGYKVRLYADNFKRSHAYVIEGLSPDDSDIDPESDKDFDEGEYFTG